MKHLKALLLMLLALMMAMPCALADEVPYAPLEPWLINKQPAPAPYTPNPDCYLPNNTGYIDDSLSITIETTYWDRNVQQVEGPGEGTTTVMAIRIKLADVTQFRTALAMPYPSKNTTRVDHMARTNNAVLAVNGDYFNYHSSGIAYRNGRKMRFNANNQRDLLIIDEQGDFHFLRPTSQRAWDNYINNGGTVLHTFWFGPCMLNEDGTPIERFTEDKVNNGAWTKAQRMVISQTGPLEYLILCNEGPESVEPLSEGYDLAQLSKLCYAFGMTNAYNLDGGSSCTVTLNCEKINSPSNPKRREVGDCIYFATLIPN
ncbi:MAG: phosphodiester glycosidase family protein [Clostridia bacterium]|nr:phosphodiester glycosidase family protein [Clostridia bacterium]